MYRLAPHILHVVATGELVISMVGVWGETDPIVDTDVSVVELDESIARAVMVAVSDEPR